MYYKDITTTIIETFIDITLSTPLYDFIFIHTAS